MRTQALTPVNKMIAWTVVGLLVVAGWGQAIAQLDIEGHKQLLQQQEERGETDSPSQQVKPLKHFQVYDALDGVVKGNITENEIADNLLDDSVGKEGKEPNVTNEMVAYSTKFSVSLKSDREEDPIDRNSYQYPTYPADSVQQSPGYLKAGGAPGYSQGYIQYPPINENLTPPQGLQQHQAYYQPHQYPGAYSQQLGQYHPGQFQFAQYQPGPYQSSQYQPLQYQPGQYQSVQPPVAEYRQSLPYGELYPTQDYLAAPLQYDATDPSQDGATQVTAKSEQKLGEQAEKRGLGLGGAGPVVGPVLPPHAGKFLGPIGGYGGHLGGLPGGLIGPGLHQPLPHRVPVPVPVQVPIVRTFLTKHINNHDHLHKHKNTHTHKGRQRAELEYYSKF